MTRRRRFTADFKAKVALEALRGDRTIQEIAGKHKVHPNQVSTWKRQAVIGGAIPTRIAHLERDHARFAKIEALNDSTAIPKMDSLAMAAGLDVVETGSVGPRRRPFAAHHHVAPGGGPGS